MNKDPLKALSYKIDCGVRRAHIRGRNWLLPDRPTFEEVTFFQGYDLQNFLVHSLIPTSPEAAHLVENARLTVMKMDRDREVNRGPAERRVLASTPWVYLALNANIAVETPKVPKPPSVSKTRGI
jgi:hypothetical protein